MATKTYEFTVEGHGDFPFDMLRYDCCFPVGSHDVSAMAMTHHEDAFFDPRRVSLVTTRKDTNKEFVVTPDRWKSFGWKVVAGPEAQR